MQLKTVPILIGSVYLFGFIVTNSHLAQFGIVDMSLASANHLIAGIIFFGYLAIFFLLGGRTVIGIQKRIGEEILVYSKGNVSQFWYILIFIRSFVSVAFYVCLSAALFSSIAYSGNETSSYFLFLFIAFAIDYWIDITKFDYKHPQIATAFQLVFESSSILVFIYFSSSSDPLIIAATYLGIVFYLNLTLDDYERNGFTTSKFIFTVGYTLFFFLGTSVTFGSLIYGKVSRGIGGGEPLVANVFVSNDLSSYLANKSTIDLQGDVNIIHSSDQFIYIADSETTLRIQNSNIRAIVYPHTTVQTVIDDSKPIVVTPNEKG